MTTTEPDLGIALREVSDLLDTVRSADSIELKLTVPDTSHRSTIRGLGLDPIEAQIRQVFFFDTPDLALNQAGLVVRARRVQGRGDDSVVKRRPVVPKDLPAKLRRSPNMVVEVDAMPGGYVCSASAKNKLPPGTVKATVVGQQPIRKLFSKEQRAFYEAHAPEGIALDDLATLGPLFVLKLNFVPEGLAGRRLVAEMWLYPDGSRILELSTKCLPGQGLDVAREVKAYLDECGVDLGGEQHTKTKAALTFFSNELLTAPTV